jgi:TPR repeat protein
MTETEEIIHYFKKLIIGTLVIILLIMASVPVSLFIWINYQKYSVTRSWERDVELFERGIKQGLPLALYGLGYAYHGNQGVPHDKKKARELYGQAANKGEAVAQDYLGSMYENGEGGKQDLQKAIYYYARAADQGYSFALMKLSDFYLKGIGVQKDIEKAKKLKMKARKNFGKSYSYRKMYKQIIKYQLGEF